MEILKPPEPIQRVGFVVPRWTTDPEPYSPGIPFRSLSVATALLKAGYEVVYHEQKRAGEPLDAGFDDFLEELDPSVPVILWQNDLNPMTQTHHTMDLATRIKQRYPGTKMIAGGTFVSICPPEKLEIQTSVDFWIRGYGEEACVELLEALRGERKLTEVSGLSWFEEGYHANEVRPHQRVRPEHNDFYFTRDLRSYIQKGGIFGNHEDTFLIGSARGCAKGCTFCYWRDFAPSLLAAEDIVSVAEHVHRNYGVRQFHLAELDFFTNRRRPLALARLFRDRLPGCTWFSLCSPQDAVKLSDADWDLLAEGGCGKLEMGAETGSPALLKAIGKKHHPEDPVWLAEKMLQRGITPMMNFLFGLVGETREDRQATLRLIHRIFRMGPDRVHLTFRFFQPAWGTPMGDEAIRVTPEYPRTIEDVLRFRGHYGTEVESSMKWLAPDDEREIKRMVYHFLPLALSNLALGSRPRSYLYRLLRGLARLRLRIGFFGGNADRTLYRDHIATSLPTTYVA